LSTCPQAEKHPKHPERQQLFCDLTDVQDQHR
jgi:hypothetical protein